MPILLSGLLLSTSLWHYSAAAQASAAYSLEQQNIELAHIQGVLTHLNLADKAEGYLYATSYIEVAYSYEHDAIHSFQEGADRVKAPIRHKDFYITKIVGDCPATTIDAAIWSKRGQLIRRSIKSEMYHDPQTVVYSFTNYVSRDTHYFAVTYASDAPERAVAENLPAADIPTF
jgi:hypothetical protein